MDLPAPFTLYAVTWQSGRRHLFDTDSLHVATYAAYELAQMPMVHDVMIAECEYTPDDDDYKRLRKSMEYVWAKIAEKQKNAAVESLLREAVG